jgi:hypothetical protein
MRQNLSSLVATLIAMGGLACQAQSYSNAVMALNPVAYWPLNETTQPPAAYVATNYGTLGALGTAYYDNPYAEGATTPSTPFTGPVPGATSDGDAATAFPGGNATAYMLIPHASPKLTVGSTPFSVEVWVQPGGGDPNDPTGTSYASTEWTSIIKEGCGGLGFGDSFDTSGDGAGWDIDLAGIYSLGTPVGWYEPGPTGQPTQFLTNAAWVVDFFPGNNGDTPSMEFYVPMSEPTAQWFHLVLVYDGTNASFYTNGVLAATTLPNLPQSTNDYWGPNQPPMTTPTGAYAFTPNKGVSFAPDTINPIILGNLCENYNFYNQGYPASNYVGYNSQYYLGDMDEVAIYTNVLSGTTVAKHYSDATAGNTTLYTNDVLSASPIVYLRLDEPAYTEPTPSTFPVATNYGSFGSAGDGLYQPGTIPGAAGPAVDGFGAESYAVQINGLDAGVDAGGGSLYGTALDPQGTPPFSLTYWFRGNPADCYPRFQSTIGRGDNSWRSSFDNGGLVRWNPGAGPELASAQNYDDGAWHMFAGVTDGTNDYLYIDGVLSASGSGVGSDEGQIFDVLIGGAPDYLASQLNGGVHERYFAGELTEAAFFTNALTASTIQALYYAADLGPSFTQEPPASAVIVQGATGTLAVTVSGTPPLTYNWYWNSSEITDGGVYSGAGSNILTITGAQSSDAGSYTVVVTNNYGAVTSSVEVLTIATKPVIVTQPSPSSTTLYDGNEVTFTVAASGATPLYYQWYEGATAISGATSDAYTATAREGTNTYSVIVSNNLGTQPSGSVTVIGEPFVAPATGFAVNYNCEENGAYKGLGVYPDAPANTNWNVFPAPPGGTTGDAVASSGVSTLVTYSMNYGFDNGVNNVGYQGSPCFLVEAEAGINSGSPGIGTSSNPEGAFAFHDVPPGVYTLYVYSANYDGNRGSIISVGTANGGQADGGTNATVNVQSDHTCDTMVEGDNYVYFHDVVPDPTGTISGTYVPNPAGQLTGEGQIDGVQLVMDIANVQHAAGGNVTLTWTGGSLQSAPTVTGPWTTVNGASPLNVSTLGTQQQYFRVY